MRSLTASALTEIATRLGTEPITVIGVEWDAGVVYYADRDTDSIKGRILNVSNLDNVVTVSESNDSQEISVTIDDTDGTIKTIMGSYDIHKKNVWVYQWFEGLDWDDKFLIFKGKINTPIIWSEGERTVSFAIVSQIEDKEIGFSPEEGQFPFIPNELIGQPWPMIFGTPIDVPCVQITKAITGTTLQSVGIVSGQDSYNNTPASSSPPDLAMLNHQKSHISLCASAWAGVDDVQYAQFNDQYNQLSEQAAATMDSYQQNLDSSTSRRDELKNEAVSQGEGPSQIEILGGEDFPRGPLTLNIGDGAFAGAFIDNIFNISSRQHAKNAIKISAIQQQNHSEFKPNQDFHFVSKVPDGRGGLTNYETKGTIIYQPTSVPEQQQQQVKSSWYDSGSRVVVSGSIIYIASIIPGTVLRVRAFKDFEGIKRLIDLPTELYSVENVTYGTIETVQVTTTTLLSSIEDQEWGDDLYVTFESSIGPNIVDILTYLINTYTDFSIDAVSFASVSTKLTNFPANFAYLERKNIVDVLSEIAFQARCSLRLVNDIFYLNYLAEEPTTVDTLTENDIENQSIKVSLTSTEDLVTKYTAKWRISLAQDKENKIILRHNVNKYGIQEEEYDYYIYNQPDIILKVATFWLIRKSNTWKQISFNTFLSKLNLETFDAVQLDFTGKYIADNPVTATIRSAAFDSENQTIEINCWLPVKAGTMVNYDLYWPANVAVDYFFPTQDEIDLNLGGGGGIGMEAEGELPIGNTTDIDVSKGVWVGGPNIVWGPQSDRGDKYPTDQGFTPQSLNIPTVTGELVVTSKPDLYLGLNYLKETPKPDLPALPPDPEWLVLEQTKIKTTESPNVTGYFSNFLVLSEERETFAIKTGVSFTDGENIEPFDFQFDTEGEKWGAGTAFLQE